MINLRNALTGLMATSLLMLSVLGAAQERNASSGKMIAEPHVVSTYDLKGYPDGDLPEVFAPDNPREDEDGPEGYHTKPLPYDTNPADNSDLLGIQAAPSLKTPGFQSLGPNGWVPPDPTVASGPYGVIVAKNDDLAFYDRDGNQQFTTDINAWWGDNRKFFDPKLVYDNLAGRFYIVYDYIIDTGSAAGSETGWLLMASDDNQAPGSWHFWYLNAGVDGGTANHGWMDYPYVGYDNDSVSLSGTLFPWYGSTSSTYAKLRFLRKSEILAGSGLAWWDFWAFTSVDSSGANTIDRNLCIADLQTNFGQTIVINAKQYGSNALTVRVFSNTSFPSSGPTYTTTQTAVAAYTVAPNAQQAGTAVDLEVIDCRILHATYALGNVFCTNTSSAYTGTVSSVGLYHLDMYTGGFPATSVNYFGSAGYNYFYPAIANSTANPADAVVLFNRSSNSSSEYAGLRMAGYQSSAWSGSSNIKVGEGIYTISANGRFRWGDYSGAASDKFDNRGFWLYGEYAETGNTFGTWLQRVSWKPDYSVTANSIAGQVTDTVNLTATVRASDTLALLSGVTVNFMVGTTNVGSASTNASGVATLAYTIPLGVPSSFTITASCDDSITYDRGSDTSTLTTSKANTASIMYNRTVEYGANVNFHGYLYRTTDFLGLSGYGLDFTVNGGAIGTVATSSGDAFIDWTANLVPAVYNTAAIFNGPSSFYNTSSGAGTVTINKAATTVTAGNASGTIGSPATLTAHLSRNHDGAAIGGRTISFTVAGVGAGSAVTNASGDASLSWNVAGGVLGANAIIASFAGDAFYLASNGTATFNRFAGTTLVIAPASGQRLQSVPLTATLTRTYDGALIGGQTIQFTVDAVNVGSAVTNASGVATLNFAIPLAATLGSHPIGASFAGSGFLNASSDTDRLTVVKWDSAIAVSNASGTAGQAVNLSATLRRNIDSALLAGKTVNFSVGGVGVGSAVTNASGVATLGWTVTVAALGNYVLTASFAGDVDYNASSNNAIFTRTGKTLSGLVILQDWTASTAGIPIHVDIYKGAVLEESFNTTLDASSRWTKVNSVTSTGAHQVYIKPWHWLRRVGTFTFSVSGNTAMNHNCINGDIDLDDEVGPGDFGLLSSAYGSVSGDPNWNIAADLDGDGEVGPSDFGILSTNYGQTGD